MKRIGGLFFLIVFLAGFTVMILAANKSGFAKIVKIAGRVSVKRRGGDKRFKAVKGMRLVEGDTLYTDKKSNVIIVFQDNTQIVIGKDSTLHLRRIKKIVKKASSIKLHLKKGSVFSNIKHKLKKRENFEITAVNLIAGVRGTKFYVSTDGRKTSVRVLKGKIKLKSLVSPKSLLLKKGDLATAAELESPHIIEDKRDKELIIREMDDDFLDIDDMEDFDYEDEGDENKLEKEDEQEKDKDKDKDKKEEDDEKDNDEQTENQEAENED